VDDRAEVHKLVNYRDLLSLNCDGRWHIQPGAQSLDLCLLAVHLEPSEVASLAIVSNKEFKQFSQDRDIVCEIQISVRVLIKLY